MIPTRNYHRHFQAANIYDNYVTKLQRFINKSNDVQHVHVNQLNEFKKVAYTHKKAGIMLALLDTDTRPRKGVDYDKELCDFIDMYRLLGYSSEKVYSKYDSFLNRNRR